MKISLILLVVVSFAALHTYAQQQQAEESIRQQQYEQHGKAGQDQLNAFLGSMAATPAKEYQFPLSLTQHIVMYEKGATKSESDVKFYINSDSNTFAIDGANVPASDKRADTKIISVYDNAKSALLMFNQTDKTLFAMNTNAFKSRANMEAAKKPSGNTAVKDMKCSKSGKTKTILGYECYEYVCQKEGSKARSAMWVNSSLKMEDVPFMMGRMPSYYGKATGITGAILEIDSYNEDGELVTTMTVTEINRNEDLRLVSADYKLQQMPTMNFKQ